jgi:hypothetical protein
MNSMPDVPLTAGAASKPASTGKLGFVITRGPSGTVLTMDWPEPDAVAKPATPMPPMPDTVTPEAMAMVQQMFRGARVRLVLSVDGRITKTNAPASLVDGSTITLLEADFDKMLAAPDALQKLRGLQSLDLLRKAPDIPGLRVLTERQLTVEFVSR